MSGAKGEKRCNEYKQNKLNLIEYICKTCLNLIGGGLQSFCGEVAAGMGEQTQGNYPDLHRCLMQLNTADERRRCNEGHKVYR